MHKECIICIKISLNTLIKFHSFYVLSTSFLRNRYYGVYELHIRFFMHKKAVRQRLSDGSNKPIDLSYYSAIRSSIMVQADFATLVPGPKIAATPAL